MCILKAGRHCSIALQKDYMKWHSHLFSIPSPHRSCSAFRNSLDSTIQCFTLSPAPLLLHYTHLANFSSIPHLLQACTQAAEHGWTKHTKSSLYMFDHTFLVTLRTTQKLATFPPLFTAITSISKMTIPFLFLSSQISNTPPSHPCLFSIYDLT